MLYYLFYVSHSQELISRCPGDGGSYDTPFTDQLCGPHKSGGSTNLMPGEAKHYCSPDKETGPTWPGAQHSGDTEVQEWYYTGFHGSSEGEGSEKQGPVYQASKASS